MRLLDDAGLHVGGRDQLRAGVPPLPPPRRPPLDDDDHRVGVRREGDRARRRPLRHDRVEYRDRRRRARRHDAVPHPEVQAWDRPTGAAGGGREARPLRPRPALTQDNAFWFEGAKEHRLLIQRCAQCGTLRHPPRPMCPSAGRTSGTSSRPAGRGTVYSFVVNHYPQVPAFDYPLAGRAHRARGGHAPRRQRRRRRARRHQRRHAGRGRVASTTTPTSRCRRSGRASDRLMDFTFSEEQEAVRDLAGADLRRATRPSSG